MLKFDSFIFGGEIESVAKANSADIFFKVKINMVTLLTAYVFVLSHMLYLNTLKKEKPK